MNPFAPAPTSMDLRWRLFGIGFRVHPQFWIVGLVLGLLSVEKQGPRIFLALALWIACMFVSVIVHELGHVLAGRLFGQRGDIILYGMGGLAVGRYDLLSRWQRIVMLCAGPGFGFLFLAVVVHLDALLWNVMVDHYLNLPFLKVRYTLFEAMNSNYPASSWYQNWGGMVISFLIFMNLFWNVLNLIPVIPLDGGRIMAEVVGLIYRRGSERVAFGLSFVCAGLIVVASVLKLMKYSVPYYPPLDPTFNLLMFLYLGMQNFTALRMAEAQERQWEYRDE